MQELNQITGSITGITEPIVLSTFLVIAIFITTFAILALGHFFLMYVKSKPTKPLNKKF